VLGQGRMHRSRMGASRMDRNPLVGRLCLQAEITPSRVSAIHQVPLWGKLKIHEVQTRMEFTFLGLFGKA